MPFQEAHVDPSNDVRRERNKVTVRVTIDDAPKAGAERNRILSSLLDKKQDPIWARSPEEVDVFDHAIRAITDVRPDGDGRVTYSYEADAKTFSIGALRSVTELLGGRNLWAEVGKHGPEVQVVEDKTCPGYWNHLSLQASDGKFRMQTLSHYEPGGERPVPGSERAIFYNDFCGDMAGMAALAYDCADAEAERVRDAAAGRNGLEEYPELAAMVRRAEEGRVAYDGQLGG